jgi:hypothetical protein
MTILARLQWQSPQMLGASLLVGVLIVLAVVLLYPAQVRLLPMAWRFTLPALRCAALLALAVSVARPVAQRTLREDEQGAVVVIVDQSKSMDVRDNQRTPAMLVALADGLGRLPPKSRTRDEVFAAIAPDIDRLPGVVEAINQAQVELDVAELQGKENPQARKRFDDEAKEFTKLAKSLAAARSKLTPSRTSKALEKALKELGELPKVDSHQWAAAVEITIANLAERAAQFQTSSDEDLYQSNPQVKSICDELGRMSRFQLAEQALVDPQAGLLAKLPAAAPLFGYAIGPEIAPIPLRGSGQTVKRILIEPHGAKSDLTGGLREIMDLLHYQPVQSVVLFSDGRQVGAETSIASSLLGSSAPIYTICPAPLGKGARIHDLSIERVSMPQSMFIGETLNVSVEVNWTGLRGKEPQVMLQVAGSRQSRAAKGQNGHAVVEFAVPVNEPGPQKITITAAPFEGEISTENNSITRWVKVLSEKFDVLLVGGSASWDFRYLRNALSRTQWITSQSVLLDRDDVKLSLAPDQILTQDVIILCDTPAKALSGAQWEAVRKVVAQRGGSVILMAGQAHLPREYSGEFFSEFLPYRRPTGRGAAPVWRTWPGEEPEYRVVPAPNAPVGDILSLDDNAQISADRWIVLPPMFRYLAMPDLKDLVQPLLAERGSGAPILTRQRLGRGKIFFLGVDETWRWRNKVGERDQDRFFRQLVRAAADEPYAASNNFLALDADRITIEPGDSVRVRARLIDPSSQPPDWPGLDIEVLRDDNVVKTQRLNPAGAADSGRYEGSVGDLEEGEYRLRVNGPEGSELQYPLHVARSFEAEMSNLSPDESLLKRLASSSGGQFRTLEQFKELPPRLSVLREREPRTAEFRLWSSWYLYAFVLACLGAEWALRKRLGLA